MGLEQSAKKKPCHKTTEKKCRMRLRASQQSISGQSRVHPRIRKSRRHKWNNADMCRSRELQQSDGRGTTAESLATDFRKAVRARAFNNIARNKLLSGVKFSNNYHERWEFPSPKRTKKVLKQEIYKEINQRVTFSWYEHTTRCSYLNKSKEFCRNMFYLCISSY